MSNKVLIEELQLASTAHPELAALLQRAASALQIHEPRDGSAPCREIMELYNRRLGDCLAKATKLPPSRRSAINARWNEAQECRALEWWDTYFTTIAASDFLCGRTKNPWRPNLDWFLKPLNMAKVIEGTYKNRGLDIGESNRRMLGFGA